MVQSVQDDLRDIRDQHRTCDKSRERYETLAIRFSSLPKHKEYSLIREDTFQLFEGRKQYFHQLFSYIARINKFKAGADIFFVEKCLGTASELADFIEAMWAMTAAMKEPASTMRTRLSIWQKDAKAAMMGMDQKTTQADDQVRARYSPDSALEPTKGAEKEGYLMRKRQKGLGPSWKRVFVALKGSLFVQYVMGHRRGSIERSFELHVLLCELRPADADRRHCFEVHTSVKTYIYQAESEENMRDWIRVFENAKNHALRSSGAGDLITPAAEDTSIDEDVELFNNDPGNQIATVPTTPLTSKRLSDIAQEFERFSHIPYSPSETLFVSFMCLWEEEVMMMKEVGDDVEVRGGVEENQEKRFSYRKVRDDVEEGQEKRSSYKKITSGFGKLYGTERALYFGSNLFGVKHESIRPWSDIKSINYTMGEATGMLTIDEGTVRARTFLNERERSETIMILWRNSRCDQPKTASELRSALQSSAEPLNERPLEASEVPCGCTDHLEKNEIDIVLPVEVDELFKLLMGDESPVWRGVQEKCGYTNVRMTPWAPGDDGKEERSAKYVVPVNHPLVKAKETECVGYHMLLRRDPGKCYVVKQTASTPGVPYGETFTMISKYCMTLHSPGHSRLRTFVGLNWIKSPLVKSMIRSSTLKGLSEYMGMYRKILRAEIRRQHPEAPEEVEDAAETKAALEAKEILERSWWSDYTELIRELLNDIKDRWRHNLEEARISVPSFLLFLANLLLFALSSWLYLSSRKGRSSHVAHGGGEWEYQPPADIFSPTLLKQTSIRWTSEAHGKLYGELSSAHSDFIILRKDLRAILGTINGAECRIFHAQYMTWLADQLTECHSDLTKDPVGCADLDDAWNNALRQSCSSQG